MKKQEITIPKGCRAIIEDGVIIIEEIKPEKPEFKRGDILFTPSLGGWIYIYKKERSDTSDFHYSACDPSGRYLDYGEGNYLGSCRDNRIATESEKQLLFDALAKIGKEWDAEKMEVVDIDWPKETDKYFFPMFTQHMYIGTIFISSDDGDIFRKKHNLCFGTKEEAIAKTKEFLNIK